MMCLMVGCKHVNRNPPHTRSPSWNIDQICSCCAKELFLMNPNDTKFDRYNFKNTNCKSSPPIHKFGKPTKEVIIDILKEKPLTRLAIRHELQKRFGHTITVAWLYKHTAQLKKENKIFVYHGVVNLKLEKEIKNERV